MRGARLQGFGGRPGASAAAGMLSAPPWPRRAPISPASPAVPRRPSGWGGAPTAAGGTRWSRRRLPPRTGVRRGSQLCARLVKAGRRCRRRGRAAQHRHRRAGQGAGRRVVPGSLVLLGGDPGIGKSTLPPRRCGEALRQRARSTSRGGIAQQTKMRADRLGSLGRGAPLRRDRRRQGARRGRDPEARGPGHRLIQTMFLTELGSAPGTLSQVREVAGRLMAYAKRSGVPTFLVGHVTRTAASPAPGAGAHGGHCPLLRGRARPPFRILRAQEPLRLHQRDRRSSR
jgi:hypothetical protein